MHLKMSSAICFNGDQSKILLSDNGLNIKQRNKDELERWISIFKIGHSWVSFIHKSLFWMLSFKSNTILVSWHFLIERIPRWNLKHHPSSNKMGKNKAQYLFYHFCLLESKLGQKCMKSDFGAISKSLDFDLYSFLPQCFLNCAMLKENLFL